MKKTYLCVMAAAALLASCDPTQSNKDYESTIMTESAMDGLVTFTQTDAEGNPAADGNYIKYTTNPSTIVRIYNLNSKGEENQLALGASGSFVLSPRRGSDPNQTVYIQCINSDLSTAEVSAVLNVYVQTELAPEMKLAVSDEGKKVWTWDTEAPDGVVWGNMGYCGGSGADVGLNGSGKWWGVTSEEEFLGQMQHSNTGLATGEESMDAYMIWDDEGTITKYAADGTQIGAAGSFEILNYDDSDPAAWKVGTLKTSEGAILWPFEINSGGNRPTEFDICYLSVDKMCLVYPDKGDFAGLGNWGEASFWHFKSNSDLQGMLLSYEADGKAWTWNTEATDGVVWGNMGYCGGSGADVGLNGSGKWWGVTSEDEFLGQMQHSNTGEATGEESMDAYMLFTQEGKILKYDANGNELNSGTYQFEKVEGNEWKVGNLNTSAGAILWPFEINSGGNMPTTFEVVYLSNSAMTLVYPDKGDFSGLGNWGEASFWQFKAK